MESAQAHESVRTLRFMSELPVDARNKISDILFRISAVRSLPAGSAFITEDEHIDNKGYVLLEGAIFVHKAEHQDITCEAPELLGEMQQFNPSQARTATVTTSMPSTVLRFQWNDFWKAATEELGPQEVETIRKSLENSAWEHFTG